MQKSIFEFRDYKAYVNQALKSLPREGRGVRVRLAEHIGCQRAFISQVLQRDSHFNLEHGDKINSFLNHSDDEAHFFLLLIQLARAGTESLRNYFHSQISKAIATRLQIRNRIANEKQLSAEGKQRYYSAWYYGAIRVAVSIPALRTRAALLRRFRISAKKLNEVLDFLVSVGLVRQEGNNFFHTDVTMILGSDSALITKHHTNWRMHTIQALDNESELDVHFSSVWTLTQSDAQKLKSQCVDFVVEMQKTLRASKEETLCSFCLDFYEL